jgi:hypothetical protein
MAAFDYGASLASLVAGVLGPVVLAGLDEWDRRRHHPHATVQ